MPNFSWCNSASFLLKMSNEPNSDADRATRSVQKPARMRTVRSFGASRGRITRAQQNAYQNDFPRFAVPYQMAKLDPIETFGRLAPVVLEIGFGMGETTASIAQAHPQLDFLAIEVFEAGIGSLSRRLNQLGLGNVRIVQHDAVEVVRDMLAPGSLSGAHIYFPDPWPKARHHKRRLVAPAFISELADRLRTGAHIHCATDWQDYAEQMLGVLSTQPCLRNLHPQYAPAPRNPLCERPSTRFHARGERLGHGVWDLVFLRT